MNRSAQVQKKITVALLLVFFCLMGYLRVLNHSMKRNHETMQYLDEHVLQAPVMLASMEKVEADRRIIRAIRGDDLERFTRLVSPEMTPETRVGGQAISMLAVSNGAEKIWAYLLERGADTNVSDGRGKTLLMEAVYKMHPEIVTSLLEHGAKANAEDKNKNTALVYAGMSRTFYGNNAQAGQQWQKWDTKRVRQIILPLLECGPNPKAVDLTLSYAVGNGHLPLVRLLLDHGANPDEGIGNSVSLGNWDMTELLLDRGAKPDDALFTAIENRNLAMVHLLIERRADVNHKKKKETPLHYASRIYSPWNKEKEQKIIQTLIKAGAKEAVP